MHRACAELKITSGTLRNRFNFYKVLSQETFERTNLYESFTIFLSAIIFIYRSQSSSAKQSEVFFLGFLDASSLLCAILLFNHSFPNRSSLPWGFERQLGFSHIAVDAVGWRVAVAITKSNAP